MISAMKYNLDPEYIRSAVHFPQITAQRGQPQRRLEKRRPRTHHNPPESVHDSCDLASKPASSDAAESRSHFVGVLRHGGAEQRFSFVREGGEESLPPDGGINR